MSRIRELREEATRPELLDSIKEMKIKIRDYGDRYDVVSPEELAQQLDADETDSWETSPHGARHGSISSGSSGNRISMSACPASRD